MGAMINEDRFGVVSISIDVASVAANDSSEQDFTVQGLKVGDFVAVSRQSFTVGIFALSARVSADNTLSIHFANVTAGALDPTAKTYQLFWFRPEKTTSVVNA